MKPQPRIAIDLRLARASGIGTYLTNVVPRIIAARPGWRFELLGRLEELREFSWAAAEQVSLVSCDAPVYGIREQIQLATRIPRGTDLVWSPHYNIPLGYRGQLVVTIHDVSHLALPDLISRVHRRAYARLMFAAVKRRASAIVCVSDFTNREFRRLVGSGRATPVTILNGVSSRWFGIKPGDRPHPRPFLLFVGNVKPHKNLQVLLEAFISLANEIPHDLVIVGKTSGLITPDTGVLRAAHSLNGRIHFTGQVAEDLLEQYYVHAAALVFPSRYEGFGLPPLEAMACGCPTIVSRAGALPEVCGSAALYFDPASAQELAALIGRVVSDQDLRRDLADRGRSHAQRFSWDHCATDTLRLLAEHMAMSV